MSSALQFPYEPENSHPHYLWNEQEYVLRMLMQHSIGVSIDETANYVTVSHNPALSLNFTANGPADFPSHNITEQFATNQTIWIYLKADGTQFYSSSQPPKYNQYLHGWYHSSLADRAVVFIDSEQPANYRCFIMDSQNCMTEYDWRIPDYQSGDISFFEKTTLGEFATVPLTPGNYRIHIKGGRGGNGGANANFNHSGGNGTDSEEIILKIRVVSTIRLNGLVGANGDHGKQGGSHYWRSEAARQTIAQNTYTVYGYNDFFAAGGGGSSGEDSFIKISDNGVLLAKSIGGAGGGGAAAIITDISGTYPSGTVFVKRRMYGAGGGGAGSGNAQNGSAVAVDGMSGDPGKAGGAVYGGDSGKDMEAQSGGTWQGMSWDTYTRRFRQETITTYPPENEWPTGLSVGELGQWLSEHSTTTTEDAKGEKGEDLNVGNRRNGGDSVAVYTKRLGDTPDVGQILDFSGLGGKTILNTTNGYVKIYKTREIA